MLHVRVIAEIGSNWLGDLSLGKRLIKEVRETGADAVKFQMWRARELYDEKHPFWKEIVKSEMSYEQAKALKEYSDRIGLSWGSSCFYPEAVEFLESIGVGWFKIAHRRSERDFEVMRRIAKTRKPIVLSTTEKDNVSQLLALFPETKDITLLHCVPDYPTSDENASLKRLGEIERFGHRIGLSDHTLGVVAPLAAIGLGATVVEKHVKLDASTVSPDAPTSITVSELDGLVKNIRRVQKMLAGDQ